MAAPGDPAADVVTPTPPLEKSLGDRAAKGAALTFGGQGARFVLQLASVVVLSRLLTPDDYGLLAIVLVVVGIGEILRDFGLTTAAVQARTLSDRQRDVLFWLNTGLGVVLCGLVFAGAPLLAHAFGRPELTELARALSFTFLVNGLATQYRADLMRRLRFKGLVLADLSGQALGFAVAVVAAAAGAGYHALAVQQLVQVTTVLIGVVLAGRWRPGRPRRNSGVRPLLRLGGHFVGTTLLYYAMNNLDTLTIALRFPPSQLGLYTRGFQLVMTPAAQARAPASTVALPVLSRLQDDHERAGRYLVRGQLAFGYSLVAALGFVAGVSVPLVEVLLGPKWDGIALILTFLAVAAAMSMLAYVGSWVYQSRGMGKALLRFTAVTFVLQLVCIVVGSIWGVEGVAAGYAVAATLEWPLSLWWLSRRTSIPTPALVRGAGRIAGAALLGGLAAYGATKLVTSAAPVFQVLAGLGADVTVYVLLALLCAPIRRDLRDVLEVVRKVVRR